METKIPPNLRWSCRRGMLELDVLLGYFLEEAYLTLPSEEQSLFRELLDENDQDLFMWLTGKLPAPNPQLALIVGKIRHHARNRHTH
jgi:antitoxin CptB